MTKPFSVGELLARVEQEQDAPAGDIFWGGSLSTTRPKMELFADYQSSNEAYTAEEFKNSEGMLTRFTDVPSVLMVNQDLIGNLRLEGYADLLQPGLKGKIAMCSPTNSSSAYEHLINMLYAMGGGDPEAGWDYVAAFCENLDGRLLDSSAAVYQGVADGKYVAGLTFEEGGANYISAGENIRLVYMEEGVVSTPDVVCIIKGAPHLENARKFVDFVTSKDTQTLIAYRLNRRSVRTDVAAPDYLKPKDQIRLISADEATVNQNKADWLARFSRLFADASGGEEEK